MKPELQGRGKETCSSALGTVEKTSKLQFSGDFPQPISNPLEEEFLLCVSTAPSSSHVCPQASWDPQSTQGLNLSSWGAIFEFHF